MGNFVSALILLFTVVSVLTIGIAAAYGSIVSILSLLAPRETKAMAAPVLAASQSLVSGD